MKFRITFKDPDGVYEGIEVAAQKLLKKVTGVTEEERELLKDSKIEFVSEFTSNWIEYGEYLTVEFDMETNSARIVPMSESQEEKDALDEY
jgi:hypothetical protein